MSAGRLFESWLDKEDQRHCEAAVAEALSHVHPTSLKQDRSRVLRFGWSYSQPIQRLASWPSWLEELRLRLPHVPPAATTAITLNEYAPGHRIGPHVDSDIFGEPIQILSLGSSVRMEFTYNNKKLYSVLLPPGSLFLLSDEARWHQSHQIEPVLDYRYSVVFRELLLSQK